jgi:poly(hydroxyalkanoate) depolymerase family esterase
MNDPLHSGIVEATRLTRAGRLTEATALLQQILHIGKNQHSASPMPPRTGASSIGDALQTIELVAEHVEIGDPEPSSPTAQEESGTGITGMTVRGARAQLPEALRRFLNRIAPTRFTPNPDELVEPTPGGLAGVSEKGWFLEKSYSNQAGTRAYKLYVPSRYCGQPLPLIVMLHGCTQSPDDFATGTRMNLRAEEHNCFVAYPAQPASANPSKCWNWFRPGDQTRGQGEPALIVGITRQVMTDYSVDEERVYAAGLSAGAAAAAILAATYPDLYAAIGVHSGLACGAASDVASSFAAMRQSRQATRRNAAGRSIRGSYSRTVPAIVFHGDQDSTVHPHNGDQVIAQLREASTADLRMTVEHGQASGGRAYERTLHCDAGGHVVLEQWVIRGAAHAWSGGSPAGSYTDPQGPDATGEMLRFFLEHPLSS